MQDRRGRYTLIIATAALALSNLGAGRQTPNLEQVLAAGSGYLARYVKTMSGVVAEETYEQVISALSVRQVPVDRGPALSSVAMTPLRQRKTLSDVVLLKVAPPLEWKTFRDVFNVDGAVVRDHDIRLARVSQEVRREAAEAIANESARYNLGISGEYGHWLLNEPGLPLLFLQKSLRSQFDFSMAGRDGELVIVRYRETTRPTLFTITANRGSNPASGRIWISPTSGEVIKCELVVTPGDLQAVFTTDFQHDTTLGIAVPVRFNEHSTAGVGRARRSLDGAASYSRYRRFEVTVDERPR